MNASAEEPIGVLGVDDQAVFLEVAREVVTATPGFHWVGDAASGEEALRAVDRLTPDLVLLDVRMRGMDGIEAAARITQAHPGVVVILISIEDASAIAPAVAACGASELVRKQEFGPKMLRVLWQRHRKTAA